MDRVCKKCNKQFFRKKSAKGVFCSRFCYWESMKGVSFKNSGQFKKGCKVWNKGFKGYHLGEKNPKWKGSEVGYFGLHTWVGRRKGKAKKCIVCSKAQTKTGKSVNWANLDGKYKRNKNDFMSLCVSCHRRWDMGTLAINLFEWNERRIAI